LSYNELIMIH